MGKVSTVEINGHLYRYEYQDGNTVYLGPVGDAPTLSETEFMAAVGEVKPWQTLQIQEEIFDPAWGKVWDEIDSLERDINQWSIDAFNEKYGIDVEIEEPIQTEEGPEHFIPGELGRGDRGGIGISTEYDRSTPTNWNFSDEWRVWSAQEYLKTTTEDVFENTHTYAPSEYGPGENFYKKVYEASEMMADDTDEYIEEHYDYFIDQALRTLTPVIEKEWKKQVEERYLDKIKTDLESRGFNVYEKSF
jgi:hypothetical protein